MKKEDMKKFAIIILPFLFPVFLITKNGKNTKDIIFLFLVLMQWVLYIASIHNAVIGLFSANIAIIALFAVNPYFSRDVDRCYAQDSFFMNKLFRVLWVVLPLLALLPIVDITTFMIDEWFIAPFRESAGLVKPELINWTAYHRLFAWILLGCWGIFQMFYSTRFFAYMKGENDCEEAHDGVTSSILIVALVSIIALIIRLYTLDTIVMKY